MGRTTNPSEVPRSVRDIAVKERRTEILNAYAAFDAAVNRAMSDKETAIRKAEESYRKTLGGVLK